MADEAVERWLKLVEDDLRQVVNNLKGPMPSLGGAAYHCQQAGEKLVKAVRVGVGRDFPRTHDIAALVGLVPSGHAVRASLEQFVDLTPFAVAYRYPAEDEVDPPNTAELENWRARLASTLSRLRGIVSQ